MKENKKGQFTKAVVTVIYDDESTEFEMSADTSILEAALDRDLDVPHSCQGGVCTSCMAKVTDGKVEMKTNSVLTDDEIEEGYTLTCQARPVTEKVTVDYDEI